MGLLLVMSAVPWSRLTGNKVKDFNLFEDLVPSQRPKAAAPTVEVDPEMEDFLAEAENEAAEELPKEENTEIEEIPVESAPIIEAEEAPRGEDGEVMLEYYTDSPLSNFKTALSSGKARVAVLGDSFIEGDIFTQDLRRLLQESYGGSGVGYVAMHTDFPASEAAFCSPEMAGKCTISAISAHTILSALSAANTARLPPRPRLFTKGLKTERTSTAGTARDFFSWPPTAAP